MSRPKSLRRGRSSDDPMLVGAEDGAPARYIVTTGLGFGLIKGSQRWVTGDGVDGALESGLFVEIHIDDPDWQSRAWNYAMSTTAVSTGADLTVVYTKDNEPQGTPTGDPNEPLVLDSLHALYDSDKVGDMSIPKTIAWIDGDLGRAEVVEARESAREGEGMWMRKGVMDHVTALLEPDET